MARRLYVRQLTVRLAERELVTLRRHADQAGLSLSRYLVESGLRGCPPPSAEDRAQRQRAIFHAKKIGTNLNQIAHWLNGEALVATTQALAQLTGREKS